MLVATKPRQMPRGLPATPCQNIPSQVKNFYDVVVSATVPALICRSRVVALMLIPWTSRHSSGMRHRYGTGSVILRNRPVNVAFRVQLQVFKLMFYQHFLSNDSIARMSLKPGSTSCLNRVAYRCSTRYSANTFASPLNLPTIQMEERQLACRLFKVVLPGTTEVEERKHDVNSYKIAHL